MVRLREKCRSADFPNIRRSPLPGPARQRPPEPRKSPEIGLSKVWHASCLVHAITELVLRWDKGKINVERQEQRA